MNLRNCHTDPNSLHFIELISIDNSTPVKIDYKGKKIFFLPFGYEDDIQVINDLEKLWKIQNLTWEDALRLSKRYIECFLLLKHPKGDFEAPDPYGIGLESICIIDEIYTPDERQQNLRQWEETHLSYYKNR